MAQTTNCDRARFQALNGAVYGAIVAPDQVGNELYDDVTEWLAIGGELSGQTLTAEEIIEAYPDYTEACE